MDLTKAAQALDSYRQIPVRLVETSLDAALKLAWDLEIYAYDAFMIECARRHRAPLMTLDAALQRAAVRMDISVIEL